MGYAFEFDDSRRTERSLILNGAGILINIT